MSRTVLVRCTALAFLAVAAGGGPVEAQQRRGRTAEIRSETAPAPTPPDSLQAAIIRLQARLDSLEALLGALGIAPEPPTSPGAAGPGQVRGRFRGGRDPEPSAAEEIAALRAAARALAPPEDAEPTQAQSVDRGTNLSPLNPEISVTGDVRLTGKHPGPQSGNVDLREFQFSVQSALDPYSTAKVFFSLAEGAAHLEEAYATWTGLPGAFRAELGRFRQQAGELNRWHLHSLPESEYPLVIREYFGEDGLVGNGVSLYTTLPFHGPGRAVHELWGQATVGSNEVLFAEGDRPSFLGHINNFWQVTSSTYGQVGGTVLWGRNPGEGLTASVLGADARITWLPEGRSLYRSLTLRGEAYGARRLQDGEGERRWGGFLSATYRQSTRLYLGARVDRVEPLVGPRDPIWAFSPNLTLWQTEWVFLRAEWQHLSEPVAAGRREHRNLFSLQVVWSLGPHKHETY